MTRCLPRRAYILQSLTFLLPLLVAACGQEATPPRPPTLSHGPSTEVRAAYNCSLDQAQVSVGECQALVSLYSRTNGDAWTNRTGWLQTATPCSWYGIHCSGGVASVQLQSNNLTGPLPPELGALTGLQTLALSHNQLNGVMPLELSLLTNLQFLALDHNHLSGAIPSSLGALNRLRYLVLNNNQLVGSIPATLGALQSLELLYLYENQLSGSIPSSVGTLSRLQYLALYDNRLTGAIPASIGGLSNAQSISLDLNQLAGALPPTLGALVNLTHLGLSQNRFSGPIPPEMGQMSRLQSLELANNSLSGPIPTELGQLGSLASLSLTSNQLTGNLPTSLGNLSALRSFSAAGNNLSGVVPLSVAQFLGLLESQQGSNCDIGSNALQLGTTTQYRAADLDMDGLICRLPFPSGGGCSLSASMFGQGWVPWGSTQYDNTTFSMARKGCAVTSMAMAFTAHFFPTDPGALNTSMKTPPGKYFASGGNVVWWAAASLGGFQYQSLSSEAEMSLALCSGEPVIVGVNIRNGAPGHFVLVTGQAGNDFIIQDPAGGVPGLLKQKYGTFAFRGRITCPNCVPAGSSETRPGWGPTALTPTAGPGLQLGLSIDDASVKVQDDQGRRVEIDVATGVAQSTVPGATAWADRIDDDLTGAAGTVRTAFVLMDSPAGRYSITIVPSKVGTPVLTVQTIDGGALGSTSQVPLLAQPGRPIGLTIEYATNAVPTPVRSGGFPAALNDVGAARELGLITTADLFRQLRERLQAAEAAWARGDQQSAIDALERFSRLVQERSGAGITEVAARVFVQNAAALKQLVLGG